MYHAAAFDAVQPGVAADRRGVVKLKDELAVGSLAFSLLFESVFAIRRKLGDLPFLAFVLAQVLDNERLDVRNTEQAFGARRTCRPK
jgi:hypothetical protein